MVTAIFLATGRDPAQNVECSSCITVLERTTEGHLLEPKSNRECDGYCNIFGYRSRSSAKMHLLLLLLFIISGSPRAALLFFIISWWPRAALLFFIINWWPRAALLLLSLSHYNLKMPEG